MTFLPIVERELRVASRRHLTYWMRLIAAAFVLLIFGFLLSVSMLNPGMPWSAGQIQFTILKWIAFIYACGAGVFLTSDSLSEEKRDGTLGLLFLTDLRGFDVVLGKLMSHSLQAFYSLLAAFPILALPLLVGGVSGTEFGHSLLIICNTLFFSLATGIFVSSISREVLKAMNLALFLNLLFLVGLPWLDLGLANWDNMKFKCITSIASPGYLFAKESALAPRDFWFQLGLQLLISWCFLVLACVLVPRAWQEKTNSQKGPRQSFYRWWRHGGLRTRLARRRKFLDENPVLWLASRDLWMARLVWIVVLGLVGFASWDLYIHWANSQGYNNVSSYHALVIVGLVLWIGSQSCRLFVESVRNGAMELILVTPIIPRRIVYGQWRALCRTFIVPVLLVIALQVINQVHWLHATRSSMRTGLTGSANAKVISDMEIQQVISLVTGSVDLIATFAAMAWFGMWMGVTSRKSSVAILKTICFVCVLPWIAQIFLQIFGFAFLARFRLPFWTNTLFVEMVELAKNVFFIVWSRKQLLTRFRDMAARAGQEPVRGRRRQVTLPPLAVAQAGLDVVK